MAARVLSGIQRVCLLYCHKHHSRQILSYRQSIFISTLDRTDKHNVALNMQSYFHSRPSGYFAKPHKCHPSVAAWKKKIVQWLCVSLHSGPLETACNQQCSKHQALLLALGPGLEPGRQLGSVKIGAFWNTVWTRETDKMRHFSSWFPVPQREWMPVTLSD